MTMQYGVLAARVEQKQERLTMVHGKWCDKGDGRRAKGEGRRAKGARGGGGPSIGELHPCCLAG